MDNPWLIRVLDRGVSVFAGECAGPLELGRQDERGEDLYATYPGPARSRLIIAGRDEDSVSRRQVLLTPRAADRLHVENLSRKVPILLPDGRSLDPGATCELDLPTALNLGRRTVRVLLKSDAPDELDDGLEGLLEPTIAPLSVPPTPGTGSLGLSLTGGGADGEAFIRWMQSVIGVLQSAASSWDFFAKAARAVVEMVGLDVGRVLLLRGDTWHPEAVHEAGGGRGDSPWEPSRKVLDRVRRERRTFWRDPSRQAPGDDASSLIGVLSIVVAPILDREGRVIGVLYGDRRMRPGLTLSRPISKLDAMLVELLAVGVAAGLARLQQEQAALALQVQFEQFFTPELAHELAEHPEMLAGRDREITVLFADIRGFSRISERLGPAGTVEWVRAVMEVLSDCVYEHDGVLVDYIGDELMAMWGTPRDQPDQAALACRAALAMLGRLPGLDARWRASLGEPMGVGIGLNTGTARVGNIGSTRKFKYGPLGDNVNLASRVQGATKYLKVPLLVTGATRAALGPEFATRRLGQVRLVNLGRPVELHEVAPAGLAGWDDLRAGYESALDHFEARQFRPAARLLGNLVAEHPDDGASLILMSRVASCLVEDPDPFDPAFRLPGK